MENLAGGDLSISGNAFKGNVEAGVVWVSQDENGNGRPDDTWYELAGSETGKADTVQRYSLTYYRPGSSEGPHWEDNLGNSGSMPDKTYYGKAQGYPSFVGGMLFLPEPGSPPGCIPIVTARTPSGGMWTI
ncbi:MAG: hypothetical protein LBB98_06835 [Treponema sp.]|nr:hypothetical protein [Treponema sp.]